VREWLAQGPQRLYWRTLTPLIMLWGMLYQRLHADHTCDAALCHLRSGAVDHLDPEDPHAEPMSQRLQSESTSAYVQGRNRLPLALIQAALRWVAQQVVAWLEGSPNASQTLFWHGRAVRVLDGTTFRLPPEGDLVETYGQAHNQKGASHWVIVKSVVSFCLYSQVSLGYAEGSQHTSEPALFRAVVAQDPQAHSVYIADQGLGVYRVAQVAHAAGHDVVLRLEKAPAEHLLRQAGCSSLPSGQEWRVSWQPSAQIVCEPGLAQDAIAGRLIYMRIEPPGFRPFDVYLFTTLLEAASYPLADICALYVQRWQAELAYRHLKTVLDMEEFDVQSAALFRKELAIGLLAYNLVCALKAQAALQADLQPAQLSFSRCLRRIETWLSQGVPAWVLQHSDPLTYLLQSLAGCRLPVQPSKVRHEPRRVRRRPAIYGPLIGDRNSAREQWLKEMA
jgi:hypothetical protein